MTNIPESAITEYKDGESLGSLAKKFKVSTSTVSNFLKSKGVAVRGRGRPPKKKDVEVQSPEPVMDDTVQVESKGFSILR